LTTSLDHIGIYVRDLERSLSFYRGVLGFTQRQRLSMGASKIAVLEIGGGLLEIIQRPEAPADAPKGRWSHIAFHIEDYDDLESKLEGMGIELRKVTLDNGLRIAFFKDPDGHDIEMMEGGLGQ
jgi:catechol 2,3-dioxygenase-like lactoylglutathione lyase family enzyme